MKKKTGTLDEKAQHCPPGFHYDPLAKSGFDRFNPFAKRDFDSLKCVRDEKTATAATII